jgi:aromatic-L-amino-acid decarboxylase
MHKINAKGEIYFTHTKLKGQMVLRLCIAQTHTTEKHVARAWEIISHAMNKS